MENLRKNNSFGSFPTIRSINKVKTSISLKKVSENVPEFKKSSSNIIKNTSENVENSSKKQITSCSKSFKNDKMTPKYCLHWEYKGINSLRIAFEEKHKVTKKLSTDKSKNNLTKSSISLNLRSSIIKTSTSENKDIFRLRLLCVPKLIKTKKKDKNIEKFEIVNAGKLEVIKGKEIYLNESKKETKLESLNTFSKYRGVSSKSLKLKSLNYFCKQLHVV
jgi:hypothetical protein